MLTDAQWARIEPLMPSSDGQRGRPFRDHRQVVEGIVYRYRTGVAWRDLPEAFGPWQTVWKRHRRFSADGTWDRIHARLLAEADAAGEIDWTVSVDSTINRAHQHADHPRRVRGTPSGPSGPPHRGLSRITRILPASSRLTTRSGRSRGGLCRPRSTSSSTAGVARWSCCSAPGRPATRRCSRRCWRDLSRAPVGAGRPRTRPDAVLGDKAYSSRANRDLLRRRGISAVIPNPPTRSATANAAARAGGRPPAFDPEAYKGRNVVERSFNDLKQWRGLATRYDKLALDLPRRRRPRAITIWLRQ